MQSTNEHDGDQPAAAWSGVKHFAVRQNLETDGIHFRPFESNAGTPQKRGFCGGGKKKMRNLGTVQVPTEAFMAVLKLDSD